MNRKQYKQLENDVKEYFKHDKDTRSELYDVFCKKHGNLNFINALIMVSNKKTDVYPSPLRIMVELGISAHWLLTQNKQGFISACKMFYNS